ncbi:MAG: DEAD/DEAH box helicase [Synergistaceae bacterium]|nr:DEAD/DEAH box helicase [Synergistaceae bacterium]
MPHPAFFNNIQEIDEFLWNKGAQIHLAAGSSSRAWACISKFPILTIFPDQRQAREFYSDCKALYNYLRSDKSVYYLNELPLSIDGASNRSLQIERGEALSRWRASGGTLVSTAGGLLSPFLNADGELSLKKGEEYGRERLIAWLERAGYRRSDVVWTPGQYVFRGLILDVYDPVNNYPARIEFYDETIESIRSFDTQNQKSIALLSDIDLHSVSLAKKISLLSCLPDATRLVLFEPKRIEMQADSYYLLWSELEKESGGNKYDKLHSWEDIFIPLSSYPRLRVSKEGDYSEAVMALEDAPAFRGDMSNLSDFCCHSRNSGYEISIFSKNEHILNLNISNIEINRVNDQLSGGFIDRVAKRIFISDKELAGVSKSADFASWKTPDEWRSRLSSGQVVVHEDYGVAIFRGVEEVVTSGEIMDALVLEFAQNQRLLVPVLQISKIVPLPQHEGDETSLDTLHGTRWRKSVAKSREQAEREAKEILFVFAQRAMLEGYSFPPEDELYKSFSKAFPYVETSDQLEAIKDVMRDMSASSPMDRLIVGDVGYGKTEVAMRAAIRAVEAGKQVVVLVPTTILAQQHGNSFKTRMTGFPVNVEVLSRFVSKPKQIKILEAVEAGKVDILIGTVRLLQKDISFRNLGLLVIDEEHRLGVLHKEHLKQKYQNIDVLTLSATPIPRTLSISLRGLKDISQLSTPPHNRIPVVTISGAWQGSLVRKAIANELLRGGQIYFVANRISRIEKRLLQLKNYFPEAKIAAAHGQMPSSELESIMLDFYDGRYDILVCTTIIESGLDIARANTLIVDDSQELGLSQMYQLRGRIGRREEAAYAYFLYPEGASIRKETAERLDAITKMTDIGSGYSLAMQDLEIRGSGEILGAAQHGRGEKGGFQFFYSMLEREIEKLSGTIRKDVVVESDINGLIPNYYIPQESVRVTLYRRLLKISSCSEIEALKNEITDRFGAPPELLKYLLDITLIRNTGAQCGIDEVTVRRGNVTIKGESSKLKDLLKDSRKWILPSDALEKCSVTATGGNSFSLVRSLAELLEKQFGIWNFKG